MERVDIGQLAQSIRESLSVTRVFGEPIERDGVTVIPVATLSGGGGGGGGGTETEGGSGGGFLLGAKPAGVYVIRDGKVSWQPALDWNKIVAVIVTLAVRVLVKRRKKRA